jgi:hypothetical protein
VLVRGTDGVSKPMFPVVPNDLNTSANPTLADLIDGNLGESGVTTMAFSNPLYIDIGGNGVYNPSDFDTDRDGCTNQQELGPSQGAGGQRSPSNPWDYFNPTQDGINRADDISAVVMKYGHDQGMSGDYDVKYDRTALAGGHPWQFGPPDGLIRSLEITAAVRSYGHDCGPYS